MTLLELIESIENATFLGLVAAGNYPEIASYLNQRETVINPNPEPQGQVHQTFSMSSLRALLEPTELAFFVRPRLINTWLADALENPAVTDKTGLYAIVDVLSESSATGELPLLRALDAFIERQDRVTLGALLNTLVQTGDLLPETAAAIQAQLSATIPDPDYQAELTTLQPSLAEQNDLPPVTPQMVQLALVRGA